MSNFLQCGVITRHFFLLGFVALSLAACSGGADTFFGRTQSGVADAFDAATGSLEDLNIRQREIPALLQKISMNPYKLPAKASCTVIRTELAELEALLGPDMAPREVEVASNSDDVFMSIQNTEIPTTSSLVDSGTELAHNALMGTIRSHTNILPFRNIIRRITGADRHERDLTNAYEAGKLRRAYLKGIAESQFGKSCLKMPLTQQASAK